MERRHPCPQKRKRLERRLPASKSANQWSGGFPASKSENHWSGGFQPPKAQTNGAEASSLQKRKPMERRHPCLHKRKYGLSVSPQWSGGFPASISEKSEGIVLSAEGGLRIFTL